MTKPTKITIDQFRQSGRDVENLGEVLQDECLMGVSGRVYLNHLYVERWIDDRAGIAPPNGPTWLLTIGRDQREDQDISLLEAELYQFAVDEGYAD